MGHVQKGSNVKNSILKSFAVVLVFSFGVSAIGFAQRSRTASAAKAAPSLLSSLPPSDAVALVNVNRVLDEALPKLLVRVPRTRGINASWRSSKPRPSGIRVRSIRLRWPGYSFQGRRRENHHSGDREGTFTPAQLCGGEMAATVIRRTKYQGKRSISSASIGNKTAGFVGLKVRDWQLPVGWEHASLGNLDSVRGVIERTELTATQRRDDCAGNSRPNAIRDLAETFRSTTA